MKRLLDVVNFNADASCLPAATWIAALQGGDRSRMCSWLRLYVELEAKVVLGFPGSTVADLLIHNPESIELINRHPEIFEVILRSFAYDLGIMRSPQGFVRNLELGTQLIKRTFTATTPYYLPAEFMFANSQAPMAAARGVRGIFISGSRFVRAVRERIPAVPYRLRGALGAELACIPLSGELTQAYLASLHDFEPSAWGKALAETSGRLAASWRDGESWLLLPRGEERERTWVEASSPDATRCSIAEALDGHELELPDSNAPHGWHYPVPSFSGWFKESRMLGYLLRLHEQERRLAQFGPLETALWAQAINSDVLSAVEKDSPVIQVVGSPGEPSARYEWTIWRSARGFEGDEFLTLLEHLPERPELAEYVKAAAGAHLAKLRARLRAIESL